MLISRTFLQGSSLAETGEFITSSISALDGLPGTDGVSALADLDISFHTSTPHSKPPNTQVPSKRLSENHNDGPETKRQAVGKTLFVMKPESKFPDPFPLPTTFSKKTHQAIEKGNISGTSKTRLLREAAHFYYSLCDGSNPVASSTYVAIGQALCAEYPQLKDKKPTKGEYWVSILTTLSAKIVLMLH